MHFTVPTSPPQSTGSIVRDSRTVLLSWSPPDRDEQNGIVREYRIQLTELHTGNISLFVSLTTTLDITSLHPDFTYEWTVAAFTIGVGPYSAVYSFSTPEDGMLAYTLTFVIVVIIACNLCYVRKQYVISV